jgi:D-threonate/D-erythronate kinase
MVPANLTLIADDLTGAADAALPFWRQGARAVVYFLPDDPRPIDHGIISVCTATRAGSARATHETLTRLAHRLPAGANLFKKIDSTLRGWVGVECAALLAARPRLRAYFAPAYPALGRTFSADGIYRVQGRPLADTEFAADVLDLPSDSNAITWIRRQLAGFTDRLEIVPAETDADLRSFVASAAASRDALWIGSAGLASALAGNSPVAKNPIPQRPAGAPPAPVVVACGTRRAIAQSQLDHLRAHASASAEPSALVILTPPPAAYDPTRAMAVAEELAQRAASAVRQQRARGLILTGGDVVAATLHQLGVTRAELVGEVEEGLPILRSEGYWIVTKAGGFGDESSLLRAHTALQQAIAAA